MKALRNLYFIICILLLLLLNLSIANTNLDDNELDDILKSSGYWNIPFNVHIYNNWSETALNYDWCSGSGTWTDPFIIENITIDSQYTGNSISIEYTSDYFKIRNCTFNNAEYGIYLYSVENGHIFNSSCSNNQESGIFIVNCQNNTIENNYLMDSGDASGRGTGDSGIVCFQSSRNLFINNLFYRNNWAGIEMQSGSSLNLILNNTFKDNYRGIYIASSSHHNNITKNLIEINSIGINLLGCNDISIHNNTIIRNNRGIVSPIWVSTIIKDCSITNNLIFNNTNESILLNKANNTVISCNEISTSFENGVHFFLSNHSLVTNNTIIDHHNNGILLEESEYNKISFNNISKSQIGISIKHSSYNNITMNRISDCLNCIFQDSNSKDNIIEDNICIELSSLSIGGFNTHTIISLIFIIVLISIFIVKRKLSDLHLKRDKSKI
jgi:parallel beta-helix repeat protein